MAQTAAELEAPALVQALAIRARALPDQVALIFQGRSGSEAREVTNGQLFRRVVDLAQELTNRDLVGRRALISCHDLETAVGMLLACISARLVAVPVPALESMAYRARLIGIIEDCRPAIALTDRNERERIKTHDPEMLSRVPVLTLADASQAVTAPAEPIPCGAGLAYLQYTSGSTSAPKGVMITHDCLLAFLSQSARRFPVHRGTRTVSWLPLYHDWGLIAGVFRPLLFGYPSILMQPMTFIERPMEWLEAISRHCATISGGPNFAYELCTQRISANEISNLDLSCWELVQNGSETVRWSSMQRFFDTFAPAGLRLESICPVYGLAEATLCVTYGHQTRRRSLTVSREELAHGVAEELTAPEAAEGGDELTNLGSPLPGLEVAIVDPASRQRLPERCVGEVWVRGHSLAAGYWGRPQETKATFEARLSGQAVGGGYLRTGDLGFLFDGELYLTSRLKDIVIVRGQNYYPPDIEATAQECSPDIRPRRVAVFAEAGTNGEELSIAFELRPSVEAVEPIVDEVRRRVARVHGVRPFAIYALPARSMPMTSSGKLARQACRQMVLESSMQLIYKWRVDTHDGETGAEA